jgi:hypothetical protein
MSGGSEFFSSLSDGASSLTSDTQDEAAVELATATAVSEKTAAAVRVVTYNVLSSSLCQADYHVKCDANNLDAWVRLRRVCDLLEPEVGMKSIICLQEVSTLWAGHLHAFFSRRDYHMIHMGYGGKFDGYMGCAIAFPTSKYVLESCKIDRVADLKKWPKLEPPGRRQRLKNWLDGVLRHSRRPTRTQIQTERERERDRQTDRQTDTHRQTHTHTHTNNADRLIDAIAQACCGSGGARERLWTHTRQENKTKNGLLHQTHTNRACTAD